LPFTHLTSDHTPDTASPNFPNNPTRSFFADRPLNLPNPIAEMRYQLRYLKEKAAMDARYINAALNALLVTTALGFLGCDNQLPTVEAQNTPVVTAAAPSNRPPVTIYVGLDKTGSVGRSKIPAMTLDQFQPLLQQAIERGGEIRVATVCTNSDRPTVSFYASEPPIAPHKPQDLPKADTVNPLDLPKLRKKYQADLAEYQAKLAIYQQAMADRTQGLTAHSQAFTAKLKPILAQVPACQASDIVGLVQRGDLFLKEAGNWRQVPKKVALLVTDGIETARNSPGKLQFSSQPVVVVVSSGGQTGILQQLMGDSKPYESIDGAVRFITSQ
jgi:hypothetical protein